MNYATVEKLAEGWKEFRDGELKGKPPAHVPLTSLN